MLTLLLTFSACTGRTDSGPPDTARDCDTSATALPEACACNDATVEVGGGESGFEGVDDGARVTMVHGPQGGWHVLAGARFANFNPIVTIHYTIALQPEGVLVSDNTYRVQMVQDAECTGFYPGMYGYLDVSGLAEGDQDTPPELLADREIWLAMEVTDTEGRTAFDTLPAVATLDPIDAAPADTAGGDTAGGDTAPGP